MTKTITWILKPYNDWLRGVDECYWTLIIFVLYFCFTSNFTFTLRSCCRNFGIDLTDNRTFRSSNDRIGNLMLNLTTVKFISRLHECYLLLFSNTVYVQYCIAVLPGFMPALHSFIIAVITTFTCICCIICPSNDFYIITHQNVFVMFCNVFICLSFCVVFLYINFIENAWLMTSAFNAEQYRRWPHEAWIFRGGFQLWMSPLLLRSFRVVLQCWDWEKISVWCHNITFARSFVMWISFGSELVI
jgi:hypothetical protein